MALSRRVGDGFCPRCAPTTQGMLLGAGCSMKRIRRMSLDIMAARPHWGAAHVESFGSGLSPISWVAQVSAPSHMQTPRRDRTAKTIRRQTVKEPTTSYIGLDIRKESIAMAIADADRAAPRFIGTINPVPAELCKAMRR